MTQDTHDTLCTAHDQNMPATTQLRGEGKPAGGGSRGCIFFAIVNRGFSGALEAFRMPFFAANRCFGIGLSAL